MLARYLQVGIEAQIGQNPEKSEETHSVLRNPWYIVAAVAFSASNQPEGVPRVFEHVLEDLRAPGTNSLQSDEKLLAQKIRDALFKSGLISGYPKVSCAWFR